MAKQQNLATDSLLSVARSSTKTKDIVWWIMRQIGVTGILLAIALCMMGFAITPIGEGPTYYRAASALLVGIWFWQKHCVPIFVA